MAANGYLDTSTLTRIPIGRDGAFGYLETNTAKAWLNAQAEVLEATGIEPIITEPDGAYRTYARQVYWRTYWTQRGDPANAAVPGHSNHGLGAAVDIFNIDAYVGENLELLVQIMAKHGFVRDVKQESWHFHHTSINPADNGMTPAPAYEPKDGDMFITNSAGAIGVIIPALAQGVASVVFHPVTLAEWNARYATKGVAPVIVADSFFTEASKYRNV